MRKILLTAAFVAACMATSAQKISYIPWTENALMQGTVISDNGKYVGGSDTEGRAFIYNTETGEIKYFQSPSLGTDGLEYQPDADIRSLTDDGVGVGYIEENAATFDFATGEYKKILDEPSIANKITTDGKIFGLTYNTYLQTPIMIADGKKTELAQATDAWLGYECSGMGVTGGSADGSVLIGLAQDNFATYPMMLWSLNKDNTTYSVVPASKKYIDESFELDGPQNFDYFEGAAISSNGKYAVINLHDKNDFENGISVARYNVETDTYELITCPELSADMYYYGNSIADDGTIVGYIEDQNSYARYGMICKGNETTAKRLAEEYPTITDLVTLDNNEANSPCMITPDGRYIAGFAYVDMDESTLCWGTYFIDTQSETDGVDNATAESKANKVVASYGIDGKKSRIAANSLRINKYANGKSVKIAK